MHRWTMRVVALALGCLLLGGGALAVGAATGAATGGHASRAASQASPAASTGCTAEDQGQDTQEQDQAKSGTPEAQEPNQGTADAQEQEKSGTETAQANEQEKGGTGTPEANQAQDQHECQSPAPGTLSQGKDLLPQAKITVAQAVTAAQAKATGMLGDVELAKVNGKLVFKVDIGDKEVSVDAANGNVISVSAGNEGD